jgi:F-type H+-transporting ATPase subunit b
VLIDWFTVTAQIVNFLVLIVLLKYFLYDRIIAAMDRREQEIRSRLNDAESKREEAEEEAQSYQRKNEEIDQQRSELLTQAKEEAEKERKSLTKKAREEVEKARSRWQESVQKEKNAFLRELRQLAANQVYAISRRALRDLADAEFEERVVQVFLSRMEDMPAQEKRDVVQAIQDEGKTVSVRSRFEISTALRRKITEMVHNELVENAEVVYETFPEMIMGVELKSRGEKIAWSLESYLDSLEQRARDALESEARKGKEESQKQKNKKAAN